MASAAGRHGRVFCASSKALMAVVALALAPPARADWPIYGHDLANTRAAGANGPSIAQARALKQAWAFKAPSGDFTGTPVVAGGVLVAGSNTGIVYAVKAATGKLLWSRNVGPQVNASAAIDLHAPGGPTVFVPVADVGAPRLDALSLSTGHMLWARTLTRQPGADVFASPVFWKGTVYIGTSGPNSDNSTARGGLLALAEAGGRVRWHTYTVPPGHDGGAVWATPAIDTSTGRIYVGTGNAYHKPVASTTDSMLVLSAATGRILHHFQATAEDTFTLPNDPLGVDSDFGASPNLITGAGGRKLVGEGSKNGVYYALTRATMRPVWQTKLGPGSQIGGILASTAYDGARIYGTDSFNGEVWALRRSGAGAWKSSDPSTLDWSPPALANHVLYTIDPSGFLIARAATSGTMLDRVSLGSPDFGGISVVGKAIYVAVGTGPPPGSSSDSSGSIIAFGDAAHSG